MNENYTLQDALDDALANAEDNGIPEVYPLHVAAMLDGYGRDILPFVARHAGAVPGATVPDWGIDLEGVMLGGDDEPTVNIYVTFVVQDRAALGALWHRLTSEGSGANTGMVNVVAEDDGDDE